MEPNKIIILVFGLICFVHSFVLALVILSLSEEKHDKSKNWLSAILLVLSTRIGKSVGHLYFGNVFPIPAIFFSHGLNFLIGPFLYIYFLRLKREKVKGLWFHFLPGGLLMAFSTMIPVDWWQEIYGLLIVQTLTYLFLSYRKIDQFLSFKNLLLGWKNMLFLTVGGVSVSFFAVILFDLNQYILPIFTYAILVYIMTLYLLKGKDIKKLISIQEKYKSSSLSHTQRSAILAQLDQLLNEEKLYRDPNLSLKLIASKIGIPESYISQTISSELSKNFNEWVNEKRVNEVCELLSNDDKHLMTIEQQAYASGFNSMSTCYTVFKKVKGITPKQYQKALT